MVVPVDIEVTNCDPVLWYGCQFMCLGNLAWYYSDIPIGVVSEPPPPTLTVVIVPCGIFNGLKAG